MPSERIHVTGVVLSTMPVGEADVRLVLLTGELGKIHVFARGAKRPKSPYGAACNPFVFGTFEIYEGRTAYTLAGVRVKRYFDELKKDYDAVCHGSYFLELADYFSRENVEAADQVNLIYLSLAALTSGRHSRRLVRAVYELRTLVHNGEYPDVFACRLCGRTDDLTFFSHRRSGCLCTSCAGSGNADFAAEPLMPAALSAMRHIITSPLRSLYSFRLSDAAEENLSFIVNETVSRTLDHPMKSAAFLEQDV